MTKSRLWATSRNVVWWNLDRAYQRMKPPPGTTPFITLGKLKTVSPNMLLPGKFICIPPLAMPWISPTGIKHKWCSIVISD